ncbi:MAG: ABC transporter permease [Candidatus Dormibacteraeota bacterium]|nr:ABC transporter permease [Candidatus Dormibacteraeota bacterium]
MIRITAMPTALLRRPLPGGMFWRELLVTATRPRSLVIKMTFPLVLTVPLLLGQAPTFWSGMLLTVLSAMIGAVGAGMAAARARESGLLARLALTPRPAWRVLTAWVAGGALIDLLQLLPAYVVIVALSPTTSTSAIVLVVTIAAILVVTNSLGFAVSALGGGAGEVLLDTVVLLAPLLFLGGLFSGVPAGGWRAIAARVDPFAALHAAFISALGGNPALDDGGIVVLALLSVVVALVLVALVAPVVVRRR